ncbi:MAG: hypothetical protein O3C34_10010 [Proteobacteria bacterium]|nr:hypothetical protein [Pseudomonadota bacterium]
MLPCRSNHYLFTTALIAGYFFATAAWSQSYFSADPAFAEPATQRNDISIGAKFKFGAASLDLNHLSLFDRLDGQPDLSTKREETDNASFTLNLSGQEASSLIPEALNLTARKTDIFGRSHLSPEFFVGAVAAEDQNDQSKSDYVISADWGASEDRFTFSFSSSLLADRPDAGEAVLTTD